MQSFLKWNMMFAISLSVIRAIFLFQLYPRQITFPSENAWTIDIDPNKHRMEIDTFSLLLIA